MVGGLSNIGKTKSLRPDCKELATRLQEDLENEDEIKLLGQADTENCQLFESQLVATNDIVEKRMPQKDCRLNLILTLLLIMSGVDHLVFA